MDKMIIALVLSFAISYFATPFAMKFAKKIGAIDVPKDNRRVHKTPIPRLGGVAIYLGFIIPAFILVPKTNEFYGIVVGSLIIVIMGIIDDVKEIKAKTKLVGQIIAALIIVFSGIRIEWITNPFSPSNISELWPIISVMATVFWIVGITNTVNLIDGLDGLAAGVSAIAAFTLGIVAYIGSDPNSMNASMMLLCLGGAAVGFLPYNFNPAKIFMGDTGSLFLGFMLAVISVDATIKSIAALSIAIPILALGLPIFDTTFAIIRRALSGKPIMQADKGHLHHRLLNKGLSQRQTVLILYGISLFLGISAIVISEAGNFECIVMICLDIALIYYGIIRLKLLSSEEDTQVK